MNLDREINHLIQSLYSSFFLGDFHIYNDIELFWIDLSPPLREVVTPKLTSLNDKRTISNDSIAYFSLIPL